MDRVTLLNRLLLIVTRADGILAAALALLLIARATPYRWLAGPQAYRWAFTVGLIFSLGWWAFLLCWLYASESHEGPDSITAFRTYAVLPSSILGAEAGVAGFFVLPKPWSVLSLVFAIANGLLTLIILALVVRVRFFRG